MKNALFISLLFALLPHTFSNAFAIDAEEYLLKRINKPIGLQYYGKCPRECPSGRLCAQPPLCNKRFELMDIRYTSIEQGEQLKPKLEEIPKTFASSTKTFKNCGNSPYKFDREVSIKVTKRLFASAKTQVTKVEKKQLTIAVDANYLKMVGAKVTSDFSNTVTWETTRDNSTLNEEVITITEPLSLTIRPKTLVRIDSKATEYIVNVPMKVVGYLDAQLSEALYISKGPQIGKEWHRTNGGQISAGYPDKELRKIESDIEIHISGYSDNLELAIYEIPLTEEDCKIPIEENALDQVIRSSLTYANMNLDESYIAPQLKNALFFTDNELNFSANLKTYKYEGYGDVSALFDVENNSKCTKHGGKITFEVVVNSNDSNEYREDYVEWRNEEEDNFELQWSRVGFLSEDEKLLGIENINVVDSFCHVEI